MIYIDIKHSILISSTSLVLHDLFVLFIVINMAAKNQTNKFAGFFQYVMIAITRTLKYLNWMVEISQSQDPKNHCFWLECYFNHGKLLVWYASIWTQCPCIYFYLIFRILLNHFRLNFHSPLHPLCFIRPCVC